MEIETDREQKDVRGRKKRERDRETDSIEIERV